MATIINISLGAVSVATKVQVMLNEACDRWRHLDDILISPVGDFKVKEKLQIFVIVVLELFLINK